jgi:RNA polymerase sigma-70 factor (ECF subfamily)
MARNVGPGSILAHEALMAGEAAVDSSFALIERAKYGDQAAFEFVLRPKLQRLLRLTLSIVDNESDARDAVQEACVLAWRELPRLRDSDRFEAWLWQIAINVCRTALRNRRRRNIREIHVDAIAGAPEAAQPGRAFTEDVSANDSIRRAFLRLDADKRTILILHHVEERPIAEIASLLGIPEGTAKWRLHAARGALTRALEVER